MLHNTNDTHNLTYTLRLHYHRAINDLLQRTEFMLPFLPRIINLSFFFMKKNPLHGKSKRVLTLFWRSMLFFFKKTINHAALFRSPGLWVGIYVICASMVFAMCRIRFQCPGKNDMRCGNKKKKSIKLNLK